MDLDQLNMEEYDENITPPMDTRQEMWVIEAKLRKINKKRKRNGGETKERGEIPAFVNVNNTSEVSCKQVERI